MNARPTPTEIINRQMLSRRIGQALVEELDDHGYVIVHRDAWEGRGGNLARMGCPKCPTPPPEPPVMRCMLCGTGYYGELTG